MHSMRAFLLTAVLVICSKPAFGLDVAIHAQVQDKDTSKIVVSTNLPEKTKGYVTIHSDSEDYFEEIEVEVSGGSFKAQKPLKPGVLRPGKYTLEVALSPAQFQPASVQSIIGHKGEFLEGDFVKAGMLGKSVRYTRKIIIDKN